MGATSSGYKSTLSKLAPLIESVEDSRIYVDFDYTLFRSSSTEEFLNLGRPAFIAAILLRVLNVLRPWSIGSQGRTAQVWRDPIRTWVLLIFMPWTLWLFKRRAQALFGQLQNHELVPMLSGIDPNRIVIVSLGYEWLIRQLVRGSPLSNSRIVGSSFFQPAALRRSGKLARLQGLDIAPVRERDVVVTDSLDDEDLLSSVDGAFLIDPTRAGIRGTLQGVYVPFDYTARVKRSTQFVVKQVFLEELIIILLATAFYYPLSLSVWIGASLLFIAFFAAYEIGYAENDTIGHIAELRPKLSDNYDKLKKISLEPAAWLWVVGLTTLGVLLLGSDIAAAALDRIGLGSSGYELADLLQVALLWFFIVALGRGVFFVYNRLPMSWRLFAYLPLHFVKYFGLVIILPSQPAGYALLYAQIVRTWSLYAIRRCDGNIEIIASQVVRLTFFVMLLIALELALPQGVFGDWHTWVILAWCVVRAAPEAKRKLFSPSGLRSGLRTVTPGGEDQHEAPGRRRGRTL